MANEYLRRRREGVPSPSGNGPPMTRAELAQAVNEYLWRTTGNLTCLDVDTIARYERGVTVWPNARYRAGLRAVLGVDDDAELGFYPTPRGRTGQSARRRLDVTVELESLRTRLRDMQALDGRRGAAVALTGTRQIVDGLWSLTLGAPPRARREVLALAAEAAEFTGWLHRDLACDEHAVHWYDRAMEYAQAAGDGQLQSLVLVRKSQMAYDRRDGLRVLLFAQAALDRPWRLTRVLRAEAMLQVARGELMTGQIVDVRRAVDAARAAGGDEDLSLREATCWIEGNNPERAAEIYGEVLSSHPISHRDRGFFSARQAMALAKAVEPARAVDRARQALAIARRTGSKRTRNAVADVVAALAARKSDDGVDVLAEELRQVS